MLNKTEFAAPLGVSVPTITQWLSILEITGQIILVPPFYENFGKRIVKSPKVYFVDSGVLCHLLGVTSEKSLRESVFHGPVFEGFVAAEIVKQQVHSGHAKALYCFRDQQGLEVDFVVPVGTGKFALIEAKASRTPTPDMAGPITRLARGMSKYTTHGYVVHQPSGTKTELGALKPGVKAIGIGSLHEVLGRSK